MDIKFSIVIPLYNKVNFIKNTIKSALDQSFKDFEIIIVDDGSTDNSLNVVNDITDERIKVYAKKNGGVSSARNYGIQKATYSYIAFLDADDIWQDTFLSEICLMIEKYSTASVFCTNYAMLYSDGKVIINNKKDLQEGFWEDYFKVAAYRDAVVWTSACCVKKGALEKIGLFNEDFSMGEDLDVWFRLALEYKFAYCNKVLATYNKYDQHGLVKSYNYNPDKSWIFSIQLNNFNKNTSTYKYLVSLISDNIVACVIRRRSDLVSHICIHNKINRLNCLRFISIGINNKIERKISKVIKRMKGKEFENAY